MSKVILNTVVHGGRRSGEWNQRLLTKRDVTIFHADGQDAKFQSSYCISFWLEFAKSGKANQMYSELMIDTT